MTESHNVLYIRSFAVNRGFIKQGRLSVFHFTINFILYTYKNLLNPLGNGEIIVEVDVNGWDEFVGIDCQ